MLRPTLPGLLAHVRCVTLLRTSGVTAALRTAVTLVVPLLARCTPTCTLVAHATVATATAALRDGKTRAAADTPTPHLPSKASAEPPSTDEVG
jgi:hypothetical protein